MGFWVFFLMEYYYSFLYRNHPFSLFSKSLELSQIFIDKTIRNSILIRLNLSIKLIENSMLQVDNFAKVNDFFFFNNYFFIVLFI